MERKLGKRLLKAALLLCLTVLMTAGGPEKTQAYQAHGYILPTSSYEYLTYEEIASLPLQVVCYAKNEIYARRGRKFVSTELQNYFNAQYWYCPIYEADQFSPEYLNVYETANVDLLASREAELGMYALDSASGYSYDVVYQYTVNYAVTDSYIVDPQSYIFYDSDRRYLTDADLAQLTLQEVCYAKNEIYARHGYKFVSNELSEYFGQKLWYWGTLDASNFSASVFNEYETANIEKLKNEEFGRAANGYCLDQPGYSYAGIGSYTSGTVNQVSNADFIFADSASRYLTDADVAGLSLQMLCYARNEIYARRGYIFQSQELRDYFGSKVWYYGTRNASEFSDSVFNTYEVSNIALLLKYEYAINPNGYQLY